MDSRALALSLLKADSEDEVIKLLKDAGYWDDPTAWRLLGDKDSNYSIVGNQQARPEAALVEKIINSVDARLMNECLMRGVDPESKNAPRSIPHAISVLFDGRDQSTTSEGTIADWTQKKTLEQAQHITVAVTGNKPSQGKPCITIVDSGEGQSPARFPDTFMSIDKANKLRIPFVQGKFNMGGTGVLKFCGKQSLQLIISRRNPYVTEAWRNKGVKWASSDPRESEWGFTVVRRELPSGVAGEVRNSIFRYLAPLSNHSQQGGQVLSFNGGNIPMFPKDNQPYVRESGHGTVVKLYEYDTKGIGSHALRKGGLRTPVEALVPQIALPIRMHECRAYGGKEAGSFDTNIVGLQVRLNENKAENLEEGYPTTASFVVNGEAMTAQIYAFKGDKADTYRTNEGIILTVNGQTHGVIPKSFFTRERVKMGRLAKSLIILIDCSNISARAREDLFMASRDRLSNGELRKQIEGELEDIIGKHPGLKELRERRRAEEIANRLQESKPLEQILDDIIKNSPALSRLFQFGQRLNKPHRAEVEEAIGGGAGKDGGNADFESRPHPTYFHFHKRKYGDILERNAEVDRRCRIKFDTDAQNDYFERAHLRGRYELEVIDGPLEGVVLDHNISVHDGVANWSIKLPEERVNVGDQLTIQCTVDDETLIEPFVNIVHIHMMQQERHELPKKKYSRSTNTSGGDKGEGGTGNDGAGGANRNQGSKISGGISMPHVIEVERDDKDWKTHEFDDETACKVIEDDEDGGSVYTFYVNVDNLSLRAEMKDRREDVALLKKKFVWGNVLIGLALLHEDKRARRKDSDSGSIEKNGLTVFDKIEMTTRAIGPFLIPMIEHLGALSEEDVASAATRGDDD
jgi:hypothetical protein